MTDPRTLTDDALIRTIDALAATARETTADLIDHLVELERRNLHLACGFKSLFGYCRRVLRCSESAAYDRMRAAHAARRFPVVVPMLAEGLLHLTAVRLLWPHLKDEDHLVLLGGAMHKSTREVRQLIARWCPRPDVAASVRKLPERRTEASPPLGAEPPADRQTPCTAESEPRAQRPFQVDSQSSVVRPAGAQSGVAPPPVPSQATRGTVSPLAPARYEFRFTGDQEMAALLQEARELLSHSLPDGDMAALFKRGLRLVVEHARQERYAATDKPGKPRSLDALSRAIPAHVQRAVWERDGGQCSFVGRGGRRCEERRYLEYHHRTPWIAGGMPSVENIALHCRAHNQYEAQVFFARGA